MKYLLLILLSLLFICFSCEKKSDAQSNFSKPADCNITITTIWKPGVDLPDAFGATYRKIDGKWKVVFTP